MSLAASHHLKKRQFEVNLTQLNIWLLLGTRAALLHAHSVILFTPTFPLQ